MKQTMDLRRNKKFNGPPLRYMSKGPEEHRFTLDLDIEPSVPLVIAIAAIARGEFEELEPKTTVATRSTKRGTKR